MSDDETNHPPLQRASDVGPSTTDGDGIMRRDGPTAAQERRPSAQPDDDATDMRMRHRDARVIYVRVNSAMQYSLEEQMEALRRFAETTFISVPDR